MESMANVSESRPNDESAGLARILANEFDAEFVLFDALTGARLGGSAGAGPGQAGNQIYEPTKRI
jgi:hypothetical protein